MLERTKPITDMMYARHPQLEQLVFDASLGTIIEYPHARYRLIANDTIQPQFTEHPPIAGLLGFMLMNPETGNGVAVMGFNAEYFDGELFATITHTPQGEHPKRLNRTDRRFLMSSGFRQTMISDSFPVFMEYGFAGVRILASCNHPKVQHHFISPKRGRTIIDQPANDAGVRFLDREFNWIVRF